MPSIELSQCSILVLACILSEVTCFVLQVVEAPGAAKCIGPGCSNVAQPDSVYCSNDCILKHAAATMKFLSSGKEQKPKPKEKVKMKPEKFNLPKCSVQVSWWKSPLGQLKQEVFESTLHRFFWCLHEECREQQLSTKSRSHFSYLLSSPFAEDVNVQQVRSSCLFLKPGSHCVSLTEILLLLPTECLGLKACTTAAWPVLGFLHIPREECFLCFKGASLARQALASHSAGITVLCHQVWLFFVFVCFSRLSSWIPEK